MKACFKCGRCLPLSEFYKHPNTADGLLGKCRACTKADVKNNPRRPEIERCWRQTKAYRESRNRYHATERGKRQRTKSSQRMRIKYPNKYHARTALGNAVRLGKMLRQPCEVCGATEHIHAHHNDYRRPLDVRWLCAKHHVNLHRDVVQ